VTLRWWCTAAALLFLTTPLLQAQEAVSDSITVGRQSAKDSTAYVRPVQPIRDTVSPPTKSTATAMLLSAVLPGAGQFYNQSYWKVPIVTGLAIYFVSEWLSNNRRYASSRDLATQYRLAHPDDLTSFESAYLNQLINVREFWKDQRDSFAWYYLILYVINLADAYVDASLFGFSVGGSLAAGSMQQPMLTLRFRF